jgi:aspartate carbamoyltransferase regulatory subunit
MEKRLKVTAIKDGTVIDHIPPLSLFKVISILELDKCSHMVTFANNLESNAIGSKAIIKVANRFFKDEEVNKISLVAPHAKLNTIRDYEVVEKRIVEIPKEIKAIVKCFNPKCITNSEKITTRYRVVSEDPIALECKYCEKITHKDEIEII